MLALLEKVRWQDLVYILLVSFILYRLLVIRKATRALQMMVGLAVLITVLLTARRFGLFAMDGLVTGIWFPLVLAVIVLFQPEIRRVLALIGQSPFGNRLAAAEESQTIEGTVRAIASLASKKIGAIIVLEREIELKDIVEMGVLLDAKVSRELLISLFLPASPLHDGAVIIKGNRVIAAGCFLPLTLGPDISKVLGTRHRAALGVTEETDAVVIVLSEETGTLSVIIGGKMTRDLDAAALRRILARIFLREKRREESAVFKKIRGLFPNWLK
jgi:diadenylate cyclase